MNSAEFVFSVCSQTITQLVFGLILQVNKYILLLFHGYLWFTVSCVTDPFKWMVSKKRFCIVTPDSFMIVENPSAILPSASVASILTLMGSIPLVNAFLSQVLTTTLFITNVSTCWNRGSTIRLTWTLRIMSLLSCHFSSFAQLVLVVITYYFSSLFSDSRRSSLATVLPVACGGDHFRKLWLYWWSLSAGTGISHGYAAYSKVFFNLVICTAMSFSSCRQHDWDAVACSR